MGYDTRIFLHFLYISGLSSDISSPVVSTTVGQWLSSLGLTDYESLFINYGLDDLEFIVSNQPYIHSEFYALRSRPGDTRKIV